MEQENPDINSTSSLLEKVVEEHKAEVISIGEIKHALNERGFGVLMALAALPLCIPFPAPPGYTTLFSVPLFILATQMIFGMESPWLPKWLEKREIKRANLAKFVNKASGILRKIEKLISPRMKFATTKGGEKFIGIVAFICAISIAVPLPLTNLPPGYGILIMSLGLLGKDGVTILIGFVIATIGCIITALILYYGMDVVNGWFGEDGAEIITSMLGL
jgi:hypothetical protein